MTIRRPKIKRSKSSNQKSFDKQSSKSRDYKPGFKPKPSNNKFEQRKKSPFGRFTSTRPSTNKPVRAFRPNNSIQNKKPEEEKTSNTNIYHAKKDQLSRTEKDCLGQDLKLGKLRLRAVSYTHLTLPTKRIV